MQQPYPWTDRPSPNARQASCDRSTWLPRKIGMLKKRLSVSSRLCAKILFRITARLLVRSRDSPLGLHTVQNTGPMKFWPKEILRDSFLHSVSQGKLGNGFLQSF